MEPAPMQHVALLDGAASGEIESRTEPKAECTTSDAGMTCSVEADLGKDDDGDPQGVACSVTSAATPFGIMLKKVLGEHKLEETPTLETKQLGEGIAISFAANAFRHDGDNTIYGTAKEIGRAHV
jgi:hypothetical protein